MKIKFLIPFLFLLASQAFAQKSSLELIDGAKSYKILTYVRYSTVYISLDSFAKALSLNLYYNPTAQKTELKFKDYNLKFTAENPFIVLTSDFDNKTNVYQLPTSTYLINGQIFVPLIYCIKPMQIALGKNLVLDNHNHLILTTQPVETEKSNDENNPDANNISGIDINEKANGTLVRINSDKSIPSYTSDFKDSVLTIVFREVNADVPKILEHATGGLITNINVRNIGSDVEFKFTLKKEFTTSEVLNADKSNDILITLHNNVFDNSNNTEKNKSKWDFDVIVIDAP